MSAAGSQIDGQRAAAFFTAAIFKILQRAHVRIGQIVHMNVVANAGAIRRRVVGAVDPQLWSVRGGSGKRQWNQMSFRIVELANFAAFVGPGGVEITETHRAQSVSAAVSLQRVFKKKFRCAVGIHRFARGPLGNRTLFGDAVHSAAGGKHEAANAGVQRSGLKSDGLNCPEREGAEVREDRSRGQGRRSQTAWDYPSLRRTSGSEAETRTTAVSAHARPFPANAGVEGVAGHLPLEWVAPDEAGARERRFPLY